MNSSIQPAPNRASRFKQTCLSYICELHFEISNPWETAAQSSHSFARSSLNCVILLNHFERLLNRLVCTLNHGEYTNNIFKQHNTASNPIHTIYFILQFGTIHATIHLLHLKYNNDCLASYWAYIPKGYFQPDKFGQKKTVFLGIKQWLLLYQLTGSWIFGNTCTQSQRRLGTRPWSTHVVIHCSERVFSKWARQLIKIWWYFLGILSW